MKAKKQIHLDLVINQRIGYLKAYLAIDFIYHKVITETTEQWKSSDSYMAILKLNHVGVLVMITVLAPGYGNEPPQGLL